jgi:hypothetical protein
MAQQDGTPGPEAQGNDVSILPSAPREEAEEIATQLREVAEEQMTLRTGRKASG